MLKEFIDNRILKAIFIEKVVSNREYGIELLKLVTLMTVLLIPVLWVGGVLDRLIYVFRYGIHINGDYFGTFLGGIPFFDFTGLYRFGGIAKVLVLVILLPVLNLYVIFTGQRLVSEYSLFQNHKKLLFLLYVPFGYLVITQLGNLWNPLVKWYFPFLWAGGLYSALALLLIFNVKLIKVER